MNSGPRGAQKQDLGYYDAVSMASTTNQDFLFLLLVEHGMTRAELQRNIDRRPALWSRFSSWLEKLP